MNSLGFEDPINLGELFRILGTPQIWENSLGFAGPVNLGEFLRILGGTSKFERIP